jgi:N-acetylglucosamine kinase-like BadF-type ATPase
MLGIDGGGSRGRMLAAEEGGRVIGAVETGPINLNNVGPDEIVGHLIAGLEALHQRFGLGRERALVVCAGVAGIKEPEDSMTFDRLLDRAFGERMRWRESVNDIVILQAAALGSRPGIALILGTGSHCYGRNGRGETATCGGWGYLMDDAGGGYAIGHAAMRAAARMWDGRQPASALADMVLRHLGVDRPGASLRRVHNTDFGFDGIKALAPLVAGLAAAGDEAAVAILQAAAAAGSELVATVAGKLGLGAAPEVVITGGVALDHTFQPLLLAAVRRILPGACLTVPSLPPAAGAVIRAALAAGVAVDTGFFDHLGQGTAGQSNEND